MVSIKVNLNDEQSALFDDAHKAFCDLLHREVPKTEFAKFAMMWFVEGLMRDDVGDDPMELLCRRQE